MKLDVWTLLHFDSLFFILFYRNCCIFFFPFCIHGLVVRCPNLGCPNLGCNSVLPLGFGYLNSMLCASRVQRPKFVCFSRCVSSFGDEAEGDGEGGRFLLEISTVSVIKKWINLFWKHLLTLDPPLSLENFAMRSAFSMFGGNLMMTAKNILFILTHMALILELIIS